MTKKTPDIKLEPFNPEDLEPFTEDELARISYEIEQKSRHKTG
jgi:hypothetical protein